MVKKLQYSLPVLCLLLFFSGTTPRGGVSSAIRVIVIDPGHGGKDPGCQGAIHREKDVSLAVGLRLGKLIEEKLKDVKVVYTRTTDVFIELEERAQIANRAKADLFISVHCNAAGKPVTVIDPRTGKRRIKTYRNKKGRIVPVETTNPVPYGTETYVMGLKNEEGKMRVATRENSAIFLEEDYEKKYGGFDPESEESYIIMSNYTSAYVIQSASLAMKLQEEYARKAGRVDKGVHRQSIWVLWRTSMPSILTELGYLTNPLEEKFLGSDQGQDYLAKAIFRGVRKYKDEVEGRKVAYNDDVESQPALENENTKAGSVNRGDEDDDSSEAMAVSPPPVKETPAKEKVSDNRYVEVVVDTDAVDSAVSARSIADRFRTESAGSKHIAGSSALVIYKVQFASSDVEINLKQGKFSAITDADFYTENKVLKYTSGSFSHLKDAVSHKNKLRDKGFSDCFVIAMKEGKRISLDEARRIMGD